MSEVKRYRFVDKHGYPALQVVDKVRAERFVEEQEYDAQRLRADTAEAERDALRYKAELYDEVWADATGRGYANVTMALCALAAAEQRIAVLKSALEGMLEYFPEGHSDGECFSVEAARAALNQKYEGESQ